MNLIYNKDAIWETDNYEVVLVGTNIYCSMDNCFPFKMIHKYPYLVEADDSTPFADQRKLGKRITVEGTPIISLLYICTNGPYRSTKLDYDALENCLRTANVEFKGKRVMTTLLGCSPFDGNGDKDKVLKIIEQSTPDLDLDIYVYEQKYKTKERKELLLKHGLQFRRCPRHKYAEMMSKQKELLKKNYLL